MFLYSAWCDLPIATRISIANLFGIVKRGSTEVFNNQIKSDGYLIKEIEQALNVDALQRFLQSEETDIRVLWLRMVNKVEGREEVASEKEATPTEAVKKRGRPKKVEQNG